MFHFKLSSFEFSGVWVRIKTVVVETENILFFQKCEIAEIEMVSIINKMNYKMSLTSSYKVGKLINSCLKGLEMHGNC